MPPRIVNVHVHVKYLDRNDFSGESAPLGCEKQHFSGSFQMLETLLT